MANEFYTLIVVPHAKARFRRIQVSVQFIKWASAISATLGLLLLISLVHYARIAGEVHELRRLRAENRALLTKTLEYEQSAGKLQLKLEYLQRTVTKLGMMAGLEHTLPDPTVGGVGGVPSAESHAPTLEASALRAMDRSLSDLTDRSNKLTAFYEDQTVLLASTPSVWPVRGYLSAGFGIVTQYGHMASFNVKPGQRLRRGDVLGFVGNTGRSTAPHLHYEVWVRDQAQNPIHYILDEYRSFG